MHLSQSQYLQVVGLLALAKQQYKQLQAIETALGELLQVEADAGGYRSHVSDVIWSGEMNCDRLLSRLSISVDEVSLTAQAWAQE
jgi:hypothetical protein